MSQAPNSFSMLSCSAVRCSRACCAWWASRAAAWRAVTTVDGSAIRALLIFAVFSAVNLRGLGAAASSNVLVRLVTDVLTGLLPKGDGCASHCGSCTGFSFLGTGGSSLSLPVELRGGLGVDAVLVNSSTSSRLVTLRCALVLGRGLLRSRASSERSTFEPLDLDDLRDLPVYGRSEIALSGRISLKFKLAMRDFFGFVIDFVLLLFNESIALGSGFTCATSGGVRGSGASRLGLANGIGAEIILFGTVVLFSRFFLSRSRSFSTGSRLDWSGLGEAGGLSVIFLIVAMSKLWARIGLPSFFSDSEMLGRAKKMFPAISYFFECSLTFSSSFDLSSALTNLASLILGIIAGLLG